MKDEGFSVLLVPGLDAAMIGAGAAVLLGLAVRAVVALRDRVRRRCRWTCDRGRLGFLLGRLGRGLRFLLGRLGGGLRFLFRRLRRGLGFLLGGLGGRL